MSGDAAAIAWRSGPISVGTEKPGNQSSWWLSNSRRGRTAATWRADELGERALDRLAVDVAPAGGGEDRHVRSQAVEDPRPVPGRVLVEQRALGRLEQVEQRAAVTAGALARRTRSRTCCTASGVSAVARNVCSPRIRSCCSCHVTPRSPRQASPLWAISVCDHTQLCWLGQHRHRDVVGQAHPLAAGDADHPLDRARRRPPSPAPSRSCRSASRRCGP